MTVRKIYDIIIIGGGLAGLTCALHLSNGHLKILLIEKHEYPHHKVCGEYVSNEVLPYLNSLGVDPLALGAKKITHFELSNNNGDQLKTKLPLGGFGLSRYAFDNLLYETIKDKVDVFFDVVESISFEDNLFTITTQSGQFYTADYVIGAFGKRSNIDSFMKRKFMQHPSPWLAVKAHYKYDFPDDTVALHNFDGGYCGLSQTETNAVNACYLTTYKSFKRYGNISKFQNRILAENPHLDKFFNEAEPLFDKPLSISQISFQQKLAVEKHIFMIGDCASLIHPLCGNGMAMAIHSAKIFSEIFLKELSIGNVNRLQLESDYIRNWNENFSRRLKNGKRIQNLLLRPTITSVGFSIAKKFPSILPGMIKRTHGEPIV